MRKALDPHASPSGTLSRVLLMTATILAVTLAMPSLASAARSPAHADASARHAAAPVHQVAHAAKTAKAESHPKAEHHAEKATEKAPLRVASRKASGHTSEIESTNIHRVSFSKTTSGDHHASRRAVQEPKVLSREDRLKKSPERSLAFGRSNSKSGKARVYASRDEVLQCVPFARAASGIELKGDAVNWWDAAAGVYERGHRPEAGAVLNFRANSNMRLGHVAVVKHIVNSREIEIDHANWAWSGKSNITRNVAVIDVSERNDWTAVRVALGGGGGDFGSVYSTYGFIYDRPDRGTMVANTAHAPFSPTLQGARNDNEVAEAPRGTLDLSLSDAPARSLR